ncbi:MAG: D-xylose transporter XylE [Jeotgalicoccus sp.]
MGTHYNVKFLITMTLIATLGGLLFGYDTAVISGAEQSLQKYITADYNSFIHGVTVSSALIGCVIGGLLSGKIAERIGRKRSLQLAAVLLAASALLSAYPELLFFEVGEASLGLLIMFNIYRIIGGIGVGLASAVTPMFIGEMAPSGVRGRLVSWNQFAIIFGMLVVYFVNYGIAFGESVTWMETIGWRYMFLTEAVPALLFFVLLFAVPETPRYLALNKQDDKAMAVLNRIYHSVDHSRKVLADIVSTRDLEVTKKKTPLFTFGKTVIIVGIMVSFFQQFIGINVALYYAPRIFEDLGAGADASMVQTVVMGLVNVVFTLVAIKYVDKIGRKPLLIVGSIGMAIGMGGVSMLSAFNVIGISTLIFIVIFTASFMMSWGPIVWVVLSEIFPNRIRGAAMAIAVAVQWLANFTITAFYPYMMEVSGAMTYGFYGLMCVLSGLFVWKFLPETKGKTLEELEKLWKKKEDTAEVLSNETALETK